MISFCTSGRRARVVVSLVFALVAAFPEASHARPSQGSPGICGYDDPQDIAILTGLGGGVVVVADTGNDRVVVIEPFCDTFPFEDGGTPVVFDGPAGIAEDTNGNIYVADTGTNRILKFSGILGLDPDDPISLTDVFSAGLSLNAPSGLGADDDGMIYIANSGAGRVQVMDSAGFPQGIIGQPDNADDDEEPGELVAPADVAVCRSDAPGELAGRIFVSDRDNDTVHAFDQSGEALFRFGDTGSAPGMFNEPGGIDVDPECNVYVADRGNTRLQMFDGDGGFLEEIGIVPQAASVAVDEFAPGGVYGGGNDEVRGFDYISYDFDGNGNSDDDGDGLPDIWEAQGIDLDFDGDIELDLPALGADPDRKTIFVEVDYLTFHEPMQNALEAVIDVFANAPVANPDGSNGIDLIVEVDDEIDETPARADLETWDEYDDIKSEFFGTQAQRDAGDAVVFAKLLAYRYGLFGHIRDGDGSSGRAKGGGNFLVTLGASGWGNDPVTNHDVGTFKEQAGTFMHELGHTLSLGHGGVDGVNNKPNYFSVMNYNYQVEWIVNDAIPDGRLDYSSQRLPTFGSGALDEDDLDETAGLGLDMVNQPDDIVRFWTGSFTDFDRAGDPIDWNAMAGASESGLSVDLNEDTGISVLQGQNDWDFLENSAKAFNFRDSVGFAEFGRALEDEEPELTDEQAQEIADSWDNRDAFKYTYSAKFLCVPLVGPESTALSPGRYQTVINIHNPSTKDVRFRKKAVIARNELEERGIITPLEDDMLADDEAISIDCASIAARFDAPQPVGDGFVVIKSNDLLDVVAVYTSRDSVDVEQVDPVILEDEEEPDDNRRPRRRADLIVELPTPTRVDCPRGQGSCIHSVEVLVSNIGAVAAGSFNVLVESDHGLSGILNFTGLPAGGTDIGVVSFGPGDNCYNPNCTVEATVDSDEEVPESDEGNNTATRSDQG